MINIWTHPVDILELSLLPYNNDNPVYKFLSQDLKTQELNDFQNSLMWLEAYRDEDTIRSLWFPTLKNQSQDLIPLLRKRVIVKDFLNTFITQPEHKEFYYPYFTSPTIHDYVTKHITWLQRYHI
jgi:hypothetical protein